MPSHARKNRNLDCIHVCVDRHLLSFPDGGMSVSAPDPTN
jgi:hypothetical protein